MHTVAARDNHGVAKSSTGGLGWPRRPRQVNPPRVLGPGRVGQARNPPPPALPVRPTIFCPLTHSQPYIGVWRGEWTNNGCKMLISGTPGFLASAARRGHGRCGGVTQLGRGGKSWTRRVISATAWRCSFRPLHPNFGSNLIIKCTRANPNPKSSTGSSIPKPKLVQCTTLINPKPSYPDPKPNPS